MEDATVSTTDDEVDAGGSLEVMDPSGHYEVRWGRKKSEVELAEATFNDLRKKGYIAFKKTWLGRKGKQVDQFDGNARALIFDKPAETSPSRQLEASGRAKEDPKDAEIVHEKTDKFDKKADHTMVPPLRGG